MTSPLDVSNTTHTEEPSVIVTGLYEVEKLKAIVDLLVRFEKEEKGQ